MPKYRKKPIVIEAWQIGSVEPPPQWLHDAQMKGHVYGPPDSYQEIVTLGGKMRGERGDWIIQGVKGELYPCKPDIFEATYEAV